MIATLTGENSFALGRALAELVDKFIAEHGDLALERLDGEMAYDRLQAALTSLPFLSARKLVILRGPSVNKQFIEQAESLLTGLPETTDLILVEPKLDKRLTFYKLLKTKTDFKEFNNLEAGQLTAWLSQQAKAAGGSIDAQAARYLVERVGVDQQALSGELAKLLLYQPKIDRSAIDLLTEPTPQSTIFELLEAAFRGDAQMAMRLYTEQRAQKAEPPQIIALLAWQLHVLALLKTAPDQPADEIAKTAKLNPFVVRKSQSIARGLSLAELKSLIHDLLQIDFRIKRSDLDADEALQNYLLKLAIS